MMRQFVLLGELSLSCHILLYSTKLIYYELLKCCNESLVILNLKRI